MRETGFIEPELASCTEIETLEVSTTLVPCGLKLPRRLRGTPPSSLPNVARLQYGSPWQAAHSPWSFENCIAKERILSRIRVVGVAGSSRPHRWSCLSCKHTECLRNCGDHDVEEAPLHPMSLPRHKECILRSRFLHQLPVNLHHSAPSARPALPCKEVRQESLLREVTLIEPESPNKSVSATCSNVSSCSANPSPRSEKIGGAQPDNCSVFAEEIGGMQSDNWSVVDSMPVHTFSVASESSNRSELSQPLRIDSPRTEPSFEGFAASCPNADVKGNRAVSVSSSFGIGSTRSVSDQEQLQLESLTRVRSGVRMPAQAQASNNHLENSSNGVRMLPEPKFPNVHLKDSSKSDKKPLRVILPERKPSRLSRIARALSEAALPSMQDFQEYTARTRAEALLRLSSRRRRKAIRAMSYEDTLRRRNHQWELLIAKGRHHPDQSVHA